MHKIIYFIILLQSFTIVILWATPWNSQPLACTPPSPLFNYLVPNGPYINMSSPLHLLYNLTAAVFYYNGNSIIILLFWVYFWAMELGSALHFLDNKSILVTGAAGFLAKSKNITFIYIYIHAFYMGWIVNVLVDWALIQLTLLLLQ